MEITAAAGAGPAIAGLPTQLTPLVGREREIASIGQLLGRADVRLVTLTGPGGVGKTSLAIHAAAAVAGAWTDGVRFCSLAALPNPDLLLRTVAQALGLQERGGDAPAEMLKDWLHNRHLLLVLDNFEHLVAAAAQVADLLLACPRLKILTTSRAALRVRGEYEFPVQPLALPDFGSDNRTAQDPKSARPLDEYPAVALFIQRAQAVRPAFAPTPAEQAAIAEICTRLDGLPLAIELAAARVKLLSVSDLLARLTVRHAAQAVGAGGRLGLLTGGARDLPARQQTMRDTIRWSYDLLPLVEQRLFRALSVFVDGCTLDAVEAVASAAAGPPALDLLTTLIDNSLVQYSEQAAGPDYPEPEPRLHLLEMIREFGQECLAAAGEADAIRAAHAAYYLVLAEAAEAARAASQTQTYLRQLEREKANLRAALEWAAEHDDEMLGRLCAALWHFWRLRGYQTEGRRWLGLALVACPAVPGQDSPLRARLLNGAALLAYYQNDYDRAHELSLECLDLYIRLGDKRGQAEALELQALAARVAGDVPAARAVLARARALYDELGDWNGQSRVLYLEATTLYLFNEFATGMELSQASYAISRAHGDKRGMLYAQAITANCLYGLGHAAESLALVQQEVLPQAQAIGDRTGIARSLLAVGRAARVIGDYATALAAYDEALVIHREMGDRVHICNCLFGFASIAQALGRPVHTARLTGVIETLLAPIAGQSAIVNKEEARTHLMPAQQQLGEEAADALRAEGAALGIDEVLAAMWAELTPLVARSGEAGAGSTSPAAPPRAAAPDQPPALDTLTEREIEVLRLIARGLTNKQIGDTLYISPHTVGTHLRSIFDKLDVTTRAAATRYALEHHLV